MRFTVCSVTLVDPKIALCSPEDDIGIVVPPRSTTLSDIAELVGREQPVKLIEVAFQSELTGWSLGEFGIGQNCKPPLFYSSSCCIQWTTWPCGLKTTRY